MSWCRDDYPHCLLQSSPERWGLDFSFLLLDQNKHTKQRLGQKGLSPESCPPITSKSGHQQGASRRERAWRRARKLLLFGRGKSRFLNHDRPKEEENVSRRVQCLPLVGPCGGCSFVGLVITNAVSTVVPLRSSSLLEQVKKEAVSSQSLIVHLERGCRCCLASVASCHTANPSLAAIQNANKSTQQSRASAARGRP